MATTRKGAAATRTDEQLAVRLFTCLASVLLRLGIDAPHAARIVREAFVLAAVKSAHTSARRATQSRVASIAGLSRLDVRNILSSRDAKSTRGSRPRFSRIERLLQGWRTDPHFLDRRGKPRALGFKGVSSEFSLLVRRYGRDVTAKTLLEQMTRLHIVSKSNEKVCLNNALASPMVPSIAALNDLRFLATRLEEFNWLEGRRTFSTVRISIPVEEKKAAQLVRQIALERMQAVMGSLGALNIEASARNGRARNKRRVLVTASIAADVEE